MVTSINLLIVLFISQKLNYLGVEARKASARIAIDGLDTCNINGLPFLDPANLSSTSFYNKNFVGGACRFDLLKSADENHQMVIVYMSASLAEREQVMLSSADESITITPALPPHNCFDFRGTVGVQYSNQGVQPTLDMFTIVGNPDACSIAAESCYKCKLHLCWGRNISDPKHVYVDKRLYLEPNFYRSLCVDYKLAPGYIVLIVIAILIVLGLLAGVIFVAIKQRNKKKAKQDAASSYSQSTYIAPNLPSPKPATGLRGVPLAFAQAERNIYEDSDQGRENASFNI